MAFSYSPKIIVDGLVLYLDAANSFSYVSGSLNWNDLSRSQISGSLQNSPGYNSGNGGSIVFDGSNDYVSIPSFSFTSDFTVVFFERITGGVISNNQAVIGNVGNGDDINHYNGYIRIYNRDLDADAVVATSPTVLNTWYNWAFTRSGTTYRIYKNGILDATSTYLAFSWDISAIGSGNVGYFQGNIPLIQIYNRALSASEILQNYNAQKSRFGLT
jgi:hypothetical protein